MPDLDQQHTTEPPAPEKSDGPPDRIAAALDYNNRQMDVARSIREQFKNHSVHGETTAHMLIALSVQLDGLAGLFHEIIDEARIKAQQGEEDET